MRRRDLLLVKVNRVASFANGHYNELALRLNIQDLGDVDIMVALTLFFEVIHNPSWIGEAERPKAARSEIGGVSH